MRTKRGVEGTGYGDKVAYQQLGADQDVEGPPSSSEGDGEAKTLTEAPGHAGGAGGGAYGSMDKDRSGSAESEGRGRVSGEKPVARDAGLV